MVNISLGLLAIGAGALMFWSLPLPRSRDENTEYPSLSIIIPARNEAERIPHLLRTLQEQKYKSFEVLVIDDDSTDDTVSVAEAYGATVLPNESTEEGAGKSAACWHGVQHSKGQWLLFLDADTRFSSPDSLGHLLALYQRKGAKGILSLQPFHHIENLYENLSAIFNIIVIAGMNRFTVWGDRFEPAGSFGPCILSDRDDYFSTGGHKKIQTAIMDDLALGQAYLDKDLPVHCMGGKGVISFRMYPEGFRSLVEGWCKSFALGSQSTHPAVMLLTIIWIAGSFITGGALISSLILMNPVDIVLTGILYLLYGLQTMVFARRCGNFKPIIFLFHPILFSFFAGIFAYSIFRVHVLRSVNWRGRKINIK
ncbi:glycosyltransferase family 2 protein [Salinicoccus sp. ID82-1]|uniref:glycosyltransferase n=1 Tax=Salinicoccus sp. ID82-1 TaxID=2820269 RepID=UPI001F247216|nr:glycosyltransferase family 2 protein [Salinicoccus sp. ID82-1]MCG1009712.1 glycosyltransferase family 2 protein [Salinicoccus sp. ID82-1]